LRKTIIIIVMSVHPSVRTEQFGSHRTDSMKFDIWVYSEKNCWENSSFIKIWQ